MSIPQVTPSTKRISTKRGFKGNLADSDCSLVSDGASAIVKDSIVAFKKILDEPNRDGRSYDAATVRNLFDEYVEDLDGYGALVDVVSYFDSFPAGYDGHATPAVQLSAHAPTSVTQPVDRDRFALIVKATKADTVLAHEEKKPLVFKKGGEVVAILMPLRRGKGE